MRRESAARYSHEDFDALHTLPYHQKHPFDRLLTAQAMQEEMIVITDDPAFDSYDVQTAWSLP